MRLEKVIIENFRSYQERIEVAINDMTTFIGKNDIGKSTILEALEIYFNNEVVKIEQSDLCVHAKNEKITIGCVFSVDPKEKIIIDSSATTTLEQEYLLNEDGFLEIHKVYDASKKSLPCDVILMANHPSNEKANDLIRLTQTQLKARVKELDIESVNKSSNVDMRQAILKSFDDLNLRPSEVSVSKGDTKGIYERLKTMLPIYSLFQSDRPSMDGDNEVQNPMKLAIKEALSEVDEELETVKKIVQEKTLTVADATLEKLKEMDEELAEKLSPQFSEEPKWEKLFKLSLDGDNEIPINKRGSGVRRLVLLNFFRAEAERKLKGGSNRSIIYAIEEPETAQHPDNQIMLSEAFKSLSETEGIQVLITTHVPGFAGLLPVESLRYIHKIDSRRVIEGGDDSEDVIRDVASALGVLPSFDSKNLKVMVLVEGIHDVECLKHFSSILANEHTGLIDLSESKEAVVIPTGGSTLKSWVEKQYLKNIGTPEVHIYDGDGKDISEFQSIIDTVSTREDGSDIFITQKRELENYISPKVVEGVFGFYIEFSEECKVPEIIAKRIHESGESEKRWEELIPKKQKDKVSNAKKRLNNEAAKLMTYNHLYEIDPEGEIKGWMEVITQLCREKSPIELK